MKKTEIEVGVHYLIQSSQYHTGYRGRVVGEGESPNRHSWKSPRKGWIIERRTDNGRKWKPADGALFFLQGYDRETGFFFVISRAIRKPWAQHLEDKAENERRTKRAKELRDEREAVEIARVDGFADCGISAKRHAHGGIYLEADEADLLLERFARLTGST